MGKYTTLRLLGHGLSSSVYLAEDKDGQQVALKYYTNKDSEEVKQKFLLESTTLKQIENPSILRVFDSGEDDDGYYLAMEYCEYGNLMGRIIAKGALDLERTLVVAVSAIRGLEVIHAAGAVHKDIRPENLFNSNDGYLKLADLGTLIDKIPLIKLPVASIYCTAPEILERSPKIDFRADIYSLGATLYYIYTGKPVFCSEDIIEVANMHLSGAEIDVQKDNADCPQSFSEILKKTMQLDPQKRYQSLAELEKDLLAVMEGVSTASLLPSFQMSVAASAATPVAVAKTSEIPVATLVEGSVPAPSSVQEPSTVLPTLPIQAPVEAQDSIPMQAPAVQNPPEVQLPVSGTLAKPKTESILGMTTSGGTSIEGAVANFGKPKIKASEGSGSSSLDMSDVKLHTHMKILVACAWLLGPALLGLYVYDTLKDDGEDSSSRREQELLVSDGATEGKGKPKIIVSKAGNGGARATVGSDADKKPKKVFIKAFNQELLPIKLEKVDADNFFCLLKIHKNGNWRSEVLTLGQELKSIRLISIKDSSAIVDFKGKAYQLELGKTYRTSYSLAVVLPNENEISFTESRSSEQNYTLESHEGTLVKLTDPKGDTVELDSEAVATIDAISVGQIMRLSYIEKSKGSVVSLVKFENEYFPIVINSVTKISANYSVFVKGTLINYGHVQKSAILNKSHQLTFIGSDWVLVKDIKSGKMVRLKVKEKTATRSAAIINYKSKAHKVYDGQKFFGYQVKIDEGTVKLTFGEESIKVDEQRKLSFLPLKLAYDPRHKVVGCSCVK